eukprot:9491775-Pyramimonas_sp.AAC.1
MLKPKLRQQTHILRDTHDLLKQLGHVEVGAGDVFVRFDIKDFFMSGSHQELVDESSELLDDADDKRIYKILLLAILRNQLISAEGTDRLWKVELGTGMGLLCSGEVADAAFHSM